MSCPFKANGLYSRMGVGALLLAGGAGMRLGGRPQALLQLGGVPLVLRQLVALSGAGVDELVLLLGHHADAVQAAVAAFPITVVHDETPGAGAAAALRQASSALSPRIDAIIVASADMPLLDSSDLVALIAAFRRRGAAQVLRPRVDGVPGWPLVIDAALREDWAAGRCDPLDAAWCDAQPDLVRWLDSDNRHYRVDIDSETDLEAFAAATGHRLTWPDESAGPNPGLAQRVQVGPLTSALPGVQAAS